MNKDTRIEIREKFSKINHTLKDYQAARDEYKQQVAKIKDQGRTYTQEHLEKKLKEAQMQLREAGKAALEAMKAQVHDLTAKLIEVDGRPIEAERMQSLSAALQLIQTGALDYKAASQVNQTFLGDQTELKTLRRAYQQANLADGGVDKMIYPHEIELLPNTIHDIAYGVFVGGDISVNQLANKIAEVARYWGITDHDWKIDPSGLVDAARQAAGLPPQD